MKDLDPAPKITAPSPTLHLDEVREILQSIQGKPRALKGFANFLYKANHDQKFFVESLLREQMKSDKEAQDLLQMERIAFLYFVTRLKETLSNLL